MVNRKSPRSAFTLVEVVVTILLISIAVVGVFSAIRVLTTTEIRARETDLLQRLARQKWQEVSSITDPNTTETDGDFSEDGYDDITWKLEVEPSETENVDQVIITVERGDVSQSLTGLLFVRPTATTGGTL